MSNCELKIVTNSKNLICSFGGMQLQMGGILPFEFLRYLSNVYKDVDLFFYTDNSNAGIIVEYTVLQITQTKPFST